MARTKILTLGMMLLVLSGIAALPVGADEVPGADTAKTERDWSVDFTPYLWIVNIDGDIGGGPIQNNFGVGIVSILEHLKGLAMVDLNLRYKRVGINADGMWAKLSAASLQPASVGSGIVSTGVDLSLAWGTGAAFYRFRPMEGLSLDPYIGARWWRIHPSLSIADIGTGLPLFFGEGVVTWADPVFGLKLNYDVTEKWRFKAAADVGGGVSKVSWQFLVGGGYQFKPWFGFELVYRVMGVDYQPDGKKIELKLNGLVVGFNFHY